jgi:hypothetical protein
MANASKAVSSSRTKASQHGRFAPGASSFVGKLAVALVCLSCVFFLTSAQDVFGLPRMWLAGLGVVVGLWGAR